MNCVKDKGKVVHILDPAPCYEDIFTAREKASIIHCTGGWVAPTATAKHRKSGHPFNPLTNHYHYREPPQLHI
jgi:hypothetical protein